MAPDPHLADTLSSLGTKDREITVTLSNELVHLLSEQMYQSPIKAIEELVVNAWDADAEHCRLFIPLPSASEPMAVVFDTGEGWAGSTGRCNGPAMMAGASRGNDRWNQPSLDGGRYRS